jgi:hypothetical protein
MLCQWKCLFIYLVLGTESTALCTLRNNKPLSCIPSPRNFTNKRTTGGKMKPKEQSPLVYTINTCGKDYILNIHSVTPTFEL